MSSEKLDSQSPSAPSSGEQRPLVGEELDAAIVKQIEFYFSPSNLSHDAFLVSKMNEKLQVATSVVTNFPGVKRLCDDPAHVVRVVMERSKSVAVDSVQGTFAPKNVQSQRNTLIVRDLPEGMTEEKCKALFGDELGASIVNVKRDVGDVFYVEFSDESTCLSGFKYIRTKEVDGKRVGVRVKSESFLKSMSIPRAAPQTSRTEESGSASPSIGATSSPAAAGAPYQGVGYPPMDPSKGIPYPMYMPMYQMYGAVQPELSNWVPPDQVGQNAYRPGQHAGFMSGPASMFQQPHHFGQPPQQQGMMGGPAGQHSQHSQQPSSGSPTSTSSTTGGTSSSSSSRGQQQQQGGGRGGSGNNGGSGGKRGQQGGGQRGASGQNGSSGQRSPRGQQNAGNQQPQQQAPSGDVRSNGEGNSRRQGNGGNRNAAPGQRNASQQQGKQSNQQQQQQQHQNQNQQQQQAQQQQQGTSGKKGGRGGRGSQGSGAGGSKNGDQQQQQNQQQQRQQRVPQLGAQDFPPLPSMFSSSSGTSSKASRQYSLERMVSIARENQAYLISPPFPDEPDLFLKRPNPSLELEREKPTTSKNFVSRPSFAEATGKRAPSSGHGGMETLPQPADSSSPPAAQMTEKTAPPAAPLSVAESAPVANATTKQREEAGEKSGAVSEGDSSEDSSNGKRSYADIIKQREEEAAKAAAEQAGQGEKN